MYGVQGYSDAGGAEAQTRALCPAGEVQEGSLEGVATFTLE